jgi:hypothetical protein
MHRVQFRQFIREAHFPVLEWGDPHFSFTKSVVQSLRIMSYHEQWRNSFYNGWFHIKLENLSLMTFSVQDGFPSYSYIDRPIDVPSFREYLASKGEPFTQKVRDQYNSEYEEVISTAKFRPHVTPIRYDFDPTGYRAGVHPVAHIHIGTDNQIRVGTRRELTPTAFLLFTMRQLYPECWERLLSKRDSLKLKRKIRDNLVELAVGSFGELDMDNLYLE